MEALSVETRRLYRNFILVVALFGASGVYAICAIIVALLQSEINVNLGIVNLWIAWRPPQRDPLAWRLGRYLTLLGGVAGAALLLGVLGNQEPWFTLLRVRLFPLHPIVAIVMALLTLAVAWWQWRTLSHPVIRGMFVRPRA